MTTKKIAQKIAEGVLDYLKKNNLEDMLPEVIDYLVRQKSDNVAYIHVPKKLESHEKISVEKLVQELSGTKPEKTIFVEDAKVIDGLKILYKDKLWDFSVSGQVDNLVSGGLLD